MQVTETLNQGLRRGYEITLAAADIEERVSAKLAEAQPGAVMNGFRKGKVPLELLRQRLGARARSEAMQESLDQAMKQHFAETGDQPARQPEIEMVDEELKEGEDVRLTFSYEALPEIPDIDFSTIELERLSATPDDTAVEAALDNLAATAVTWKDRAEGEAAAEGNQVVFDFKGTVDGEPFEGGEAEDYPLVLGTNRFVPGFEEQLVGTKVGDTPEITVRMPDDYTARQLAGREICFACTIKAVKEAQSPPIDDELARRFGATDLAQLKTQVTDRISGEYAAAARGLVKRALLDALDQRIDFDLPPSMVDAEAVQIAHHLRHEDKAQAGGDDHAEIKPSEEHVGLAKRRVGLALLLAEIGRKAGVEVSEAELSQAIVNEARKYPGRERELIDFVRSDARAQGQVRAPLFEDKVVDYILELAKVTTRNVTRDDLQKAIEVLDTSNQVGTTAL